MDSSTLKPSIVLILPQSFKLATKHVLNEDGQVQANEQYVAIVNNVQSDRDNSLLRQQYKKLSLQVRDARSPITGQLFYEHVFDYFPPNQQHLLVPINLDQVSVSQRHQHPPTANLRSYATAVTAGSSHGRSAANPSHPHQLIVSVRPYQIESGFGSDSIEFVSSAPVSLELVPSADGRRSFGVVQTDKPIYKPDEKVRIRSLIINENFKPALKDEFKIQIRNPHKLIVEELKFSNEFFNDSQVHNGRDEAEIPLFFDHLFEFPPEPILGVWTVHLLHHDSIANDTTSFEVREYVLPTFEIRFESPKYILPNTQNITGFIIAKYHYGKPVQGKAQFKFGIQESANDRPKYIARSNIKNIDPKTGYVNFKLPSEKIKETGWFPSISGYRLVIDATVTETSTGHQEIAQDFSCSFITMPYKFSFDETMEYFEPGIVQQFSVQVLEWQTLRAPPIGSLVVAQYRDQNGTIMVDASSADHQMSSSAQKLVTEAVTDQSGRAVFNLGPISDDVTSVQVTLKCLNSTSPSATPSEIAAGQVTLTKHESQSGWISLMNKSSTSLNVGDEFVSNLLIRNALVIQKKIFYIIVARGQIISMSGLDSQGLIRFRVGETMAPSMRLVLFALTQDSGELLSDSMRISVGQSLSCGLTMRYKSNGESSQTVKPNDKGKLAIKARQGDLISLIGIDSAVYSLNNRSRLDSSRIVQRVKRLDTGCGFGGGRNNLDVFHNAGLAIFKDAAIDVVIENRLGSSCTTLVSQLRHLEDIQLGYARPMFSALTQLDRPRAHERAQNIRHKLASTRQLSRHKRSDSEVEAVLKRYKDPSHRACCRLGTLEDSPQKRNCSARARIVEKYMRQLDFRDCSAIYLDCCRAVFERILLSSMSLSPRDQATPIVTERVFAHYQAPQFSEPSMNIGHLDRIEANSLIRNDFRETWLFELVSVSETDGTASVEVQLPHSITTWSVAAVALNRYQPMCIMTQPLNIVTFQEIFLQISMPYKVIQGEQIDLVATVFNYSPQEQDVLVYMYGVDDVCSEALPGERSDRKRIRIERHGSQSVLFPIIPLKVGRYQIKILAITSDTGGNDIIERTLNVVPRGKPVTDETTFSLDPMNQQRRNKRAIQTGNLLDEIDSSKGLQISKVRLTPSRDSEFIVPQTQECIVSAIGDRMGQAVQTTMLDVENLIRLPHGCGEQVMIYLGPTLYTARYLSTINKLSGELRWRAIKYIQSGYKRIINYRKENGAFSAFARRDSSIWLTAFIAKMLCQTERTPYIAHEVHVDKTVVSMALSWLIDKQNQETGTWSEVNPVYHREMLGGVLKENVLTAFVTVSLNECIHHSQDLIDEVQLANSPPAASIDLSSPNGDGSFRHGETNGVDKLRVAIQKAEQSLALDWFKAAKEKNPYVLALTAYALSFSKQRDAVLVLNDLMLLADRSQSRNQISWRGEYQVETAAYALQAILELAPVVANLQQSSSDSLRANWSPGADSVAIANWLSSKRSYSGAFESTQDTVVALEALSKFSQLQLTSDGNNLVPANTASASKPPASLTCNVTINNRTRRSIEFDRENAQVLQTFKLNSFEIDPVSGELLDIVTSGNGLGTMSVKLKYNVFQEEDELCRFGIDSSIEEWKAPNLEQTIGGTTEEDYFKSFDKAMLGELNLVDPYQVDPLDRAKTQSANNQSKHLSQSESRREVLRLRRSAAPMLDMSARNNSDQQRDVNWTSKLVSTLKAKLPTWLSPTQTKSTTPVPAGPTSNPVHGSSESHPHQMSDQAIPRRTSTLRRSTVASTMPIVNHQTGIPADAKLNVLSKQLELNMNSSNNDLYQMVGNPSHRLVLLLRICVHHMSSRRDSEMSVIEVGILSGFKPNEADLKEIEEDPGTPAMKYELSADKSLVIIYMRYIPFSGPYCLQFRLIRESLVTNIQSGYIRVYEYYAPTHSCSNFYTPTRITDLIETNCDSSGQVCQCATKSLCPATNKLLDLSEIHSVNSTSARNRLMDLVCSSRYDFVSLVRLKSVRHIDSAKVFKLSVQVKSDFKGNLTKIMKAQRQQKSQLANSVRKPNYLPATDYINPVEPSTGAATLDDEEDTSLDYLNLNIDSNCVRNDPILLHFAHPNKWKQGGELMVLFGKLSKLEKRYFKAVPKQSAIMSPLRSQPASFPRPKPTIFSVRGSSTADQQAADLDMTRQLDEQQSAKLLFGDSQQLQYSTTMLLDQESILHDMAYQAKVEPRETINNLVLWLDLRSRREKWTCPSSK